MKISLISLYPEISNIGIRSLSASLKKEGHNVQIIFLRSEFWDKYEDEALNELGKLLKGVDLIGISLTTNFFDNAIQVTQSIRKNSNAPILWGGIHPTIRPKECLDYADIVCIGESEETLVELVRKVESKQDISDVRGIWFKDKEKIVQNNSRPLVETLDSIPFPDYDYEDHYILTNKRIKKMDINLMEDTFSRRYSIMASRGCPFGCTYCSNNTLNNMYPNQKAIRKRSWNNVIEEIVNAKKKLPFIDLIAFEDDAFFLHTVDEMKEFCTEYKKYVGLPFWTGGASPSTLIRKKIEPLVDAGLSNVRMGIQSGSERTRRLYKRFDSNQQVEKAAVLINEFKNKVKPNYDIILDNPWESEEDLIEGLILLSKLPLPYTLNISSLTFYPETELYKKAKAEGIITDEREEVYHKYMSTRSCQRTPINRVYLLLGSYAQRESRISPKVLFFLTNKTLRQLKLSWLLYIVLKVWEVVITIRYYIYNGLKDIAKGDISRIYFFIKRKLRINVV